MGAADLILAVSGEIMDNKVHGQLGEFPGAAGFMSEIKREQPVWGTVDKARLADLVERGRAGDITAMEAIYEIFKGPVFSLQYRHTMNRAVAEDLLQRLGLALGNLAASDHVDAADLRQINLHGRLTGRLGKIGVPDHQPSILNMDDLLDVVIRIGGGETHFEHIEDDFASCHVTVGQ